MRLSRSLLLVGLLASATPAFAENLIPPSGGSREPAQESMRACLNTVLRLPAGRPELLPSVDPLLLQGYPTVGFLFEGSLAGPRLVAPRPNGVLAPRESLFDALRSPTRTGPYVVCLLLKGYRWESSPETGLAQLERLAAEGNVRAQAELGRAYAWQLGVTRNYTRAYEHLAAAAAAQDRDAQFEVALLFSEGNGVLPDDAQAVAWLAQAATAGHAEARRVLPQAQRALAEREKMRAEGAATLAATQAAAARDDAEAQRKLGNSYLEGWGVTPDATQALAWYKKAAAFGDRIAMRQIGVMFDKGRGIPVDYTEALRWYKAAGKNGDAQAQYNVAVMLATGVGADRDDAEAEVWLRRAAAQNYPAAVRALQPPAPARR